MKDGYIKVAAGTPEIRVADCEYNKKSILQTIKSAENQGVKLLALPEMCITGYTCSDLFLQRALTLSAEDALSHILADTSGIDMLFAVGLPVLFNGKLYNCAAVCCKGELLALVPKMFLPNYGEFYENRWFAEGKCEGYPFSFAGRETYFGSNIIFECTSMPGLCVGVEICEDLWAAVPPSSALAQAGATVILNLSASDEIASKDSYRRCLVTGQSGRLICGYIYADAGEGESTTDMVFAGHNLIAENGVLLQEIRFETGLIVSELDINYLSYERMRISTFRPDNCGQYIRTEFSLISRTTKLTRGISPTPFVPHNLNERLLRCEEIFRIAALGLKKRMEHTGAKNLVIGISGGLDSTLAMLIAARAVDMLGLPREGIIAVSMPCFGTTERTKGNSEILADELRATRKTINITAAVRQHFADIGHDEKELNIVFENSQARERTQVLMDIANDCGGLVVGTGDMSELALGWATYNGDHMSNYGVNSGIPKTLVRYLVDYCADIAETSALAAVLRDILATPVSPELLPAQDGDISQKTEELVGPYELHDFFLYHMIRRGCEPKKVLRLAEYAFDGTYDHETILKWLRVFVRRFFAQQFKRNCLPDGPKVGTLSLSPRGDLKMPSDAVCDLWLKQLN
ncbi:MAG: NAD(+) synthase [Oscillospiraceae bacterium]|nr:NAD(+) synthase [Oscillospiraceae bacterium]